MVTSSQPFPPPGYPPAPTQTATWLFERYVRGSANRHFAGVHWMAPAGAARWDHSIPTLFVANHSNWWDGFLAFLVTRALGLAFHVLMEARHLARYRAFLRVGALPLRRGQPRAAYADLSAAIAYLRPRAGLWVFPQGERRPPRERPTGCERGAAHLVRQAGVPIRICPVAFRYVFAGEQLPEAFVMVGDEWRPSEPLPRRDSLTVALEQRMGQTLDALDARLDVENLAGFRVLAAGRMSVNKRLDRVRHAAGLLDGPFEARNG
jgi:1-acyl-sn-glycerol-3-phosphate acyltransferase